MKQRFQILDRVFSQWMKSDVYYPGFISAVEYHPLESGYHKILYNIEFDDCDNEQRVEEDMILLDTTTIPIGTVIKVKYSLLDTPFFPLRLKNKLENLNIEIKKQGDRCGMKATIIKVHENITGEISYTVEYSDQSLIGEEFLKYAKRKKIKDNVELKQESKISRNRISQFKFKKDKDDIYEYIRANTKKRKRENENNNIMDDDDNLQFNISSSSSSVEATTEAKKAVYSNNDETDGYNDSDVESKWGQMSDESVENDFLLSLYDVSSTPRYNDIIKWNPNGDTVLITDLEKFRSMVLPRHFPKWSNQQLFFNQIAKYKFSQKSFADGTIIEISQSKFLKGKRGNISSIYDDERNAYLAMQEAKKKNIKAQQEREKKIQQQQKEEQNIPQPPPEIPLDVLRQEEADLLRKLERTQAMVQKVKESTMKLLNEIKHQSKMPHRQAQDVLAFQRKTREMEAINKELDRKIEAHIKLFGDVQQDYSHVISECDYNESVYGERNSYQGMGTSSSDRNQYSEMDDMYLQKPQQYRNTNQIPLSSRLMSAIPMHGPDKEFMDDIDGEPIE